MNKTIVAAGAVGLTLLLISTQAFAQSYTAADVATHNQVNDCWVTISGKAYDMSAFLNQHPGGRASIIAYCGKDATVAFATKGGQGSHSGFAYSLLPGYFVGAVSSNANTGGSTPAPTPSTPPPTPTATPQPAAASHGQQNEVTTDLMLNTHLTSFSLSHDDTLEDDDSDESDEDDRGDEGWDASAHVGTALHLMLEDRVRDDDGDED